MFAGIRLMEAPEDAGARSNREPLEREASVQKEVPFLDESMVVALTVVIYEP